MDERYRVALVVFAEAPGVDERDAANRAAGVLYEALAGMNEGPDSVTFAPRETTSVQNALRGQDIAVRVSPTSRLFR